MSRVLATILFLTGLSLITPPAHAAVSVTVSAAPSTLVVGDQAVIKGKAVNAKPGSVVKLQRKVDGTWRAVASKKVWSARTYSFALKPTRGVHAYRVVKPRQFGQPYAASPAVRLNVRWTPKVYITSDLTTDGDSSRPKLTIRGSVSDRDGVTKLRLERDTGTGLGWERYDERALDSSGRVAITLYDEVQARYRFVYPGVGLRQTAVSAVVSYLPAPQQFPVNSSLTLNSPYDDSYSVLHFYATKGVELTLVGSGHPWSTVITGPAGETIGGTSSGGVRLLRFRAPSSGRHAVRVSHPTALTQITFDLSTPKVYDVAMDGPPLQVYNNLAGQEVHLRFNGTAGDVVTMYKGADGADAALVGPSGQVNATPWGTPGWGAPEFTQAFRLQETGTFAYRLRDNSTFGSEVQILAGLTAQATVDGEPVPIVLDQRSRAAVVTFTAAKGDEIDLVTSGGAEPHVFGPPGTSYVYGEPRFVAQETGVHTAVFWGSSAPTSRDFRLLSPVEAKTTVDGEPVTFAFADEDLYRSAILEFDGSTGQVVKLFGEATSGYWGRPVLYAPNGTVMHEGIDHYDNSFLLTQDGTYRIRLLGVRVEGSLRLLSGTQVEFPADRATVPFEVSEPGHVAWARVELPAGAVVDLTMVDAAASEPHLFLTVTSTTGVDMLTLNSNSRGSGRFVVPADGVYHVSVTGFAGSIGTVWARQSVVT